MPAVTAITLAPFPLLLRCAQQPAQAVRGNARSAPSPPRKPNLLITFTAIIGSRFWAAGFLVRSVQKSHSFIILIPFRPSMASRSWSWSWSWSSGR